MLAKMLAKISLSFSNKVLAFSIFDDRLAGQLSSIYYSLNWFSHK